MFRSYSEPGGICRRAAAGRGDNPGLTKLVPIGTSVQGKRILAVKVTKDARQAEGRLTPAVLYPSAQHAREWITPEMNRRLLHHVLDGYAQRPERSSGSLDNTELWFVPVANPDGYDFTFTRGTGCGARTCATTTATARSPASDGVDPNRNYPTKWGYDNEGSSPVDGSETYRAPARRPSRRRRRSTGC